MWQKTPKINDFYVTLKPRQTINTNSYQKQLIPNITKLTIHILESD